MNETHPSSGGETESTASLLDVDGSDLRPHIPSNGAAQSTLKTPTRAPRTCRSRASTFSTKSSSWWWWEISGCLLCILSSLLLVVFLTQINQMARQDWNYRLQPNTIISLIMTIGKAAMMGPIAACISQLKWTEFRRPARLSLLQSIDDASRGPWGSLVLLTRARRTRILLIPALAFLTVAAVGFESSAQQILDFPSRMALVRNVSAEVGMATKYTSAQYTAHEGTDLLLAAVKGSNRSSIEFNILKVHNQTKLELNKPARFGAYTVGWHWCAKTFHNLSASQGELHIGTTISEALQLQTQDDIDDPASLYHEDDRYLTDWNTSSSSTLYRTLPTPFWDHINDWLGDAALKWGSPAMNDEFGGGKEAGNVIYTADMAQMVDNVASALSSLVWSNETDNLSAEKFPGDAFVTESYIHVRWQWITAVLVEALLAAALLVASIIAVRGDPLLKASVIALLVHGLEDWRDIEVLQPETSTTLEESSEEVVVRLMDNGAGRRLFVKQATE
ncbi:hypothetical protein CPLU01_06710 [Colletotrichum plurivorum]|uniref:Uncharacterized protein n=1 Tax=Colletotrichum plurivorum TaxID=2175906 RepID=A0A8H6NFJ4_9PEZI|nr:hypothetical protein CPLU01_06710 [Colletotrichum plurivorum]